MNQSEFQNEMNKQANLIINGDPRQRQELCRVEVMNTLKKFRCMIIPSITLRGDGAILPMIDIVAVVEKGEIKTNGGNGKKR